MTFSVTFTDIDESKHAKELYCHDTAGKVVNEEGSFKCLCQDGMQFEPDLIAKFDSMDPEKDYELRKNFSTSHLICKGKLRPWQFI